MTRQLALQVWLSYRLRSVELLLKVVYSALVNFVHYYRETDMAPYLPDPFEHGVGGSST